MDIRFVLPSEVEQLARNVVTSFPSKTPAALLQNMEGELHRPDEGRYLGCFDDDGTLLGSILMMDFTLNVRGVMMPCGGRSLCVSANFLHKKERGGLHAPEGVDAVLRQTGDADRLSPPLQSRVLCQHGIRLLQRELSLPAQALRDPLLRRQVRCLYARRIPGRRF